MAPHYLPTLGNCRPRVGRFVMSDSNGKHEAPTVGLFPADYPLLVLRATLFRRGSIDLRTPETGGRDLFHWGRAGF